MGVHISFDLSIRIIEVNTIAGFQSRPDSTKIRWNSARV